MNSNERSGGEEEEGADGSKGVDFFSLVRQPDALSLQQGRLLSGWLSHELVARGGRSLTHGFCDQIRPSPATSSPRPPSKLPSALEVSFALMISLTDVSVIF